MEHCIIISGGMLASLPVCQPGDFVIACDKGLNYALQAGLTPDLAIGDFDSYQGALPEGIPVLRFPAVKDDTDTMLAVRYALEHGYRKIMLCCALGARMDHAMGNFQAAVHAARQGAEVSIVDDENLISFIDGGCITLQPRPGWSLTLLAWSDRCEGVTVTGARYNLQDAALTNDFPLGVSNEWTSGPVTVSVAKGILMVMMSRL